MIDFPAVHFPPGNILINLSAFVFAFAFMANHGNVRSSPVRHLDRKQNLLRFLPAIGNCYPHQAGLLSRQAFQRPGEEAQVNAPRQTSRR